MEWLRQIITQLCTLPWGCRVRSQMAQSSGQIHCHPQLLLWGNVRERSFGETPTGYYSNLLLLIYRRVPAPFFLQKKKGTTDTSGFLEAPALRPCPPISCSITLLGKMMSKEEPSFREPCSLLLISSLSSLRGFRQAFIRTPELLSAQSEIYCQQGVAICSCAA